MPISSKTRPLRVEILTIYLIYLSITDGGSGAGSRALRHDIHRECVASVERVLGKQKADYTLVGREELGRQHISRVRFDPPAMVFQRYLAHHCTMPSGAVTEIYSILCVGGKVAEAMCFPPGIFVLRRTGAAQH